MDRGRCFWVIDERGEGGAMWTRLRRDGTIGGHGKRVGVRRRLSCRRRSRRPWLRRERATCDARMCCAICMAKTGRTAMRSYRYRETARESVWRAERTRTLFMWFCALPTQRIHTASPVSLYRAPDTSASAARARYGSAAAPGRDHGAPCAAHRTSDSRKTAPRPPEAASPSPSRHCKPNGLAKHMRAKLLD